MCVPIYMYTYMYHSTHIQFVLYRHPSNGDLLLYQFPQSKSVVVVVSVVDVQFITIWWCSAWWGLCSDFLIRQEMKPRAATYYLSFYFVCAFYLTNIIISRTLYNDHNMFIRTWIYACLHNMYYIWIDYVSREGERETFLSQTPTEQQVAARIRTHPLIYRPQVYFYTSQSSIQHTPTVNWWYTIILFVEASKYTLSSTLHVLVQRA